MSKRVPHTNELAAVLHSDTSGKVSNDQEKGLRTPSSKKSDGGDLIPPIDASDIAKNRQSDTPASLFERLKARISGAARAKKNDPEAEIVEKFLAGIKAEDLAEEKRYEPPQQGELSRMLRLEIGKDKLILNQKKLTDKVRKILIAIEAQDKYLKTITLKIMSRKHRGIIIDLPQKEEGPLNSQLQGTLNTALAKKTGSGNKGE